MLVVILHNRHLHQSKLGQVKAGAPFAPFDTRATLRLRGLNRPLHGDGVDEDWFPRCGKLMPGGVHLPVVGDDTSVPDLLHCYFAGQGDACT